MKEFFEDFLIKIILTTLAVLFFLLVIITVAFCILMVGGWIWYWWLSIIGAVGFIICYSLVSAIIEHFE